MRVLIATVLALLVACGSEPRAERPVQVASPPGVGVGTPLPGGQPSFTYTKGSATVRLSGDIKRKLTLPLGEGLPATFGFGIISGSWGKIGGNLLTIAGTAKVGENKVGDQLLLFISLAKPTAALTGGTRCSITIEDAGDPGLTGRFQCPNMTSGQLSVNAKGSFTATT